MKTKSSTQGRARGRLLGVFVCIAMIIVVCSVFAVTSAEGRKTISVVKLKDNVMANAVITADMVEEYQMYYKEFENYGVTEFTDGSKRQAVVTWDNKDAILGKRFAAYYLRGGTVLFWNNTIKEQTKKNSYLYVMDGELLNINMDTADFGDMVVPGDSLNIRVKYTTTTYDLPAEDAYKLSLEGNGEDIVPVEQEVNEMLFSEVVVLDMLNSSGASIFDIYYSFIAKSKAQQTALLRSSDFLASVQPTTILLEVTAEEADRFMELQTKNPQYLMTLLPRTGGNSIIDSLAEIQSALLQQVSKED